MEKCELQKPVSQLLNALKSHFFACELYSDKLFWTIEKIQQFQQNHFCDVIKVSELYSSAMESKLQLAFWVLAHNQSKSEERELSERRRLSCPFTTHNIPFIKFTWYNPVLCLCFYLSAWKQNCFIFSKHNHLDVLMNKSSAAFL